MNKPAFGFYGIFGFPLGHTLSPAMQEAAFKAAGLKAFYLPFEIRSGEFRRLLKNRRHLLLDGFNVTVPYKETVLSHLDQVDSTAKSIGAVNVVVRRGRQWIGFNTDAIGFLTALRKDLRFQVRGKHVLLLGAGGAARAVAYALASKGAKSITISNRTVSRAQKIAADFKKLFPRVEWHISPSLRGKALDVVLSEAKDLRPEILRRLRRLRTTGGTPRNDADLVVNATFVGLRPGDRSLLHANSFPKKTIFADLIYKPAETAFLRSARRSGHRTLNGMGMLLYQGAEAFRLWTGRKAPIEVMRKTILNVTARQQSK